MGRERDERGCLVDGYGEEAKMSRRKRARRMVLRVICNELRGLSVRTLDCGVDVEESDVEVSAAGLVRLGEGGRGEVARDGFVGAIEGAEYE